jgi:hypothetical protein
MSVAALRRRLPLTAARGSAQVAYHGNSQAVESSTASVVHPAATRQSAPRAVRHKAAANATTRAPMNRCRHHVGVPLSPTRRAVSAGMLCVATSCCCSPTAFTNPRAWEPKPIRPTAPSARRLSPALIATSRRRRGCVWASARKGKRSPAVTLTPTPATTVAAAARSRGLAPTVSASAAASASRIRVSLCAPPTASSSSTGFRPTNAAAQPGE